MLTKIKETKLLETKVFTVVQKEFEGTNFKPVGLNCYDWVMVIIKDTRKDQFVFVKQTRWGEEAQTVEFPCGTIDPDELIKFGREKARLHAAIREVKEETGLDIKEEDVIMIKKPFNPNPAYFNNRMTIFYTEIPELEYIFHKHKDELNLDPDEDCIPYIGDSLEFEDLEEHALGTVAVHAYEKYMRNKQESK